MNGSVKAKWGRRPFYDAIQATDEEVVLAKKVIMLHIHISH